MVEGAGLDQMKDVCLVDSGPIGHLLPGESPNQAFSLVRSSRKNSLMSFATRSGWSNATRWPLLSYDALRNARTSVSNS